MKDFEMLSKAMFSSMVVYTKKLNDLRCDLRVKDDKNNAVFPIGYLSALVLSNIYLRDFDCEVIDKMSPCFYGRYVDDILIVLDVDEKTLEKKRSKVVEFKQKLLNVFLEKKVFKEDNGNLFIANYSNLYIQKNKVSCIHIAAKGSTNLFNVYRDLFERKPSIVNQLADFDLHTSSFSKFAYEIKTQSSSPKIRDLVTIFTQGARTKKFVDNSILCALGAYNVSEKREAHLESNLDEIITFYADAKGLENPSAWLSLFYLFVVNPKPIYANRYFALMSKEIKGIKYSKIDDIHSSKEKEIVSKAKKDFISELEVAYETAFALKTKDCIPSRLDNAIVFRKSNMFRHDLVVYPLLNFSDICDDKTFSLIDFYDYKEREAFPSNLSSQKINFTPRFVSFSELNLYYFFNSLFIKKKETMERRYDEIKSRYYEINGIVDNELLCWESHYILKEEDYNPENESKGVVRNKFDLKIYNISTRFTQRRSIGVPIKDVGKQRERAGKPRIAVASVDLSIEKVLERIEKPKNALSIYYKKKVFDLIFKAIKEQVDVLVFPEFYLPFEWVSTISKICANNRLSIISGLQYIKTAVGIKNYGITIQPILSKFGNRGSLELLREKNFYSPDEKKYFARKDLMYKDAEMPSYDFINYGELKYSSIICYELTDIKTRALLKGRANIVYAVEFNSDTNYYSNLVESLSRDIQAFVVQVNTAKYGDSRITAPYKTEQKDIVKIKGGINDTFVVGETDLNLNTRLYHRNFELSVRSGSGQRQRDKITRQVLNLSIEEKRDLMRELNKLLPKEKPLSAGRRDDTND